jgi:hypothetical protein
MQTSTLLMETVVKQTFVDGLQCRSPYYNHSVYNPCICWGNSPKVSGFPKFYFSRTHPVSASIVCPSCLNLPHNTKRSILNTDCRTLQQSSLSVNRASPSRRWSNTAQRLMLRFAYTWLSEEQFVKLDLVYHLACHPTVNRIVFNVDPFGHGNGKPTPPSFGRRRRASLHDGRRFGGPQKAILSFYCLTARSASFHAISCKMHSSLSTALPDAGASSSSSSSSRYESCWRLCVTCVPLHCSQQQQHRPSFAPQAEARASERATWPRVYRAICCIVMVVIFECSGCGTKKINDVHVALLPVQCRFHTLVAAVPFRVFEQGVSSGWPVSELR